MDTTFLAGASAGLAARCTPILNYLNSLQNPDNNVPVFALEVDQLSRSLRGLATGLNDFAATGKAALESMTGFDGQHWRNVRLVLDDCKETLTVLGGILDKAKGKEHRILKFRNNGATNVDVTTNEMILIKKQLGAFRRTLQLCSQLLTVCSVLRTSEVATNALSSQLDALTIEHQQTTRILLHLKEDSSDFHNRRVVDDIQQCLQSVGDIMNTLKTLQPAVTTKSVGEQVAKTGPNPSIPEIPPRHTVAAQTSSTTTKQPALPPRKPVLETTKVAPQIVVQLAPPVPAFKASATIDPFQPRDDDSAAIKEWKTLLNANPENVGFYKQLATAYQHEGHTDLDIAVRKFALIRFQLEKRISSVEVFTLTEELAQAVQRKGDDSEEIAMWAELVAKDPMLHTWRHQLQAVYKRQAKLEDAIMMWGEWAKNEPHNYHYISELAELFKLKGDKEQAFGFWKELVEKEPMNHNPRHELQNICTQNGDVFLDRGISIWKDLVRQYPGNFHYAPELATMLEKKGDEEDTFVFWRDIVDKYPAEAIMVSWQYLGTAYQGRNPREAVAYWKQHLYAREGNYRWQEPLAQALKYLGDIDIEISIWKDCVEKFPSAFYLCDKLSNALERKGDFDEAITVGKGLVRQNPAKSDFQECLAKALERKGDVAEELNTWRELVHSNPSVASLQERLATAIHKQ